MVETWGRPVEKWLKIDQYQHPEMAMLGQCVRIYSFIEHLTSPFHNVRLG